MLWLYQRTMFGNVTNPENAHLPDLSAREVAYFTPLIILAFAIGILPQQVILKYVQPPATYIVKQANPGYYSPTPRVAETIRSQPAGVAETSRESHATNR